MRTVGPVLPVPNGELPSQKCLSGAPPAGPPSLVLPHGRPSPPPARRSPRPASRPVPARGDNYGDNGAQYFTTFADLDPSQGGTQPTGPNVWFDSGLAVVPEPLDAELSNGDNLANAIKADVVAGTLPQVSWVVTNQRYSEHPDGAPTDGAYYAGKVLQALNADPDVFNSTLVIIDYDENDGQFDHVPPPSPPQGAADEFVLDTSVAPVPLPVGLGFRVPLLLISPWTRGGWVTSEVSDHTSVIQLVEKWTAAIGTPAICPNISASRRSGCGHPPGALH